MTNQVRVRFAPSPTGPLHIGGVRTALFNYLLAKKHGGTFILRIEDTDQKRFVPGAEQYIIDALNWCGIPFDEGPGKEGGYGPYRQSERKEGYRKYALELIASNHAYYAFDTEESLNQLRASAEALGQVFVYGPKNRSSLRNSLQLSPEETNALLANQEPYVIRFKTEGGRQVSGTDLIRGVVQFDSDLLDDKVLFKSDGMPTYHLANVVDDHEMKISHVIRGEEWLPSLALHWQLYEAFGWEAPAFAHLPLILKPSGPGKLSKRDGEVGGFPVFPLSWEQSTGYREAGYAPEAVINFLALLGWNPGDEQEVFDLAELVEKFDLARVQKSGARFDPDKTKWFNQQHLQKMSASDLLPALKKGMEQAGVENRWSDQALTQVAGMVQERAVFAQDVFSLSEYFFTAPKAYDAKAVEKQWKPTTPDILQRLMVFWPQEERFEAAVAEQVIKAWAGQKGISLGAIMAPLRLCLVGALQGPHVFDIAAWMGREETMDRIQRALDRLT
jgi:glutamyl-tRNA synthetase